MKPGTRRLGVALVFAASFSSLIPVSPARADSCGAWMVCGAGGEGAYAGLSSEATRAQTSARTVTPKEVKDAKVRKTAYWQFDARPRCSVASTPDSGRFDDCASSVALCANVKDATGNATNIWGRVMSEQDKELSGWQLLGWTCYPTEIAPRSGAAPNKGPSLMTLILQEFTRVPFTVPDVNLQPPGGRALITKPVFLHTTFTGTGNGPGEGHVATLLGHRVVITPVLQSATYAWGDGALTGPTKDTGGVWPDGRITHTYPHHGSYTVTTTVTYTATFTVDGAAARPINATTTRTASQALIVVESANVLVPNG